MKRIISTTVLAIGLVFSAAPAALAGDVPSTPVPAECQTYYNSTVSLELVAAQRLTQISGLIRTVEEQQAKIDHKNAVIQRLRQRLANR